MAKQFTKEEVKKHNNNQSSWLVIHNTVYDITEFLNEHPGGEEVLLEQSGLDGSEGFEDVGHSLDARELMEKYKIGELMESERYPSIDKKTNWTTTYDKRPRNSLKSFLFPLAVGLVAAIVYHFCF